MTTFINAEHKKSDDLTNIDKYRIAANITEYEAMESVMFDVIKIRLKRRKNEKWERKPAAKY